MTPVSAMLLKVILKRKNEDTKKEVELLEKDILDLEARKKKLSSIPKIV